MRRTLGFILALVATAPAAAAPPPQNPFTGPTGASAMHGDSLATDTTPLPGPGPGPLQVAYSPLAAACPSVLITAPGGVAVATDHSQYLLRGRRPRVLWRQAYDRGPHRKPGQLSRGTGSTPTFFGPKTGWEYLAIVDNREPVEHLRVFRTRDGRPVCEAPTVPGSENSPIGAGRKVIVASTYGYPYPATPENAGPAVPETAPFAGGVTRIDVRNRTCTKRWTSPVRSSAVPKLSLADRLVYTIDRRGGADAGNLDSYDAVALDLATGEVRSRAPLGATTAYDTLQLAGNIGPGRVLWQGTITGLLRISPG